MSYFICSHEEQIVRQWPPPNKQPPNIVYSHPCMFLVWTSTTEPWFESVYIVLQTPSESLHLQMENPLNGNTKTGKTVCVTHHTTRTDTPCIRLILWFGPGVGFSGLALPAFVGLCLGWYIFISQGCCCTWPLLYRLFLKDHTLCISVSVEVWGISFANWAESRGTYVPVFMSIMEMVGFFLTDGWGGYNPGGFWD